MDERKIYTHFLFDLDDTIFDFPAAELHGLEKVYAALDMKLSHEDHQHYSAFNKELWDDIDAGRLTRDEMQARRFPEFFQNEYGLQLENNAELVKIYQQGLAESHELLPNAAKVIRRLHRQGHYLAIVSNGLLKVQQAKLADVGLLDCFNDLFISREIGHMKPNPEFFEYVLAHSKCNTANTLVIGDSLKTDMLGAKRAGLDSVWYNRHKRPNQTLVHPTYTISDLLELEEIVNG